MSSDDPRPSRPLICVEGKPEAASHTKADVVSEAAGLLREAPGTDPDEEAWVRSAASRMRTHFREKLYGVYARHEEPEETETTGVRPSWPGIR